MAPQGLKMEFWSSENWAHNVQSVRNPYFMTNLHEGMLPNVRIEPGTVRIPGDVHPIAPDHQLYVTLSNQVFNLPNTWLIGQCPASWPISLHQSMELPKLSFKGWMLSFLFILRWMLTNLDLVVYRLRYYFTNVLNGLKRFMTKLNRLLNPGTPQYISTINSFVG